MYYGWHSILIYFGDKLGTKEGNTLREKYTLYDIIILDFEEDVYLNTRNSCFEHICTVLCLLGQFF